MSHPTGIAGRLAGAFIHSKLTPLFIVASMLLGVYAVVALPREEEPQIIVPMVDVFVDMPGASPTEVEQRVTRPIEKLLWEVPGVEYLYSTSMPGRAMLVVRFLVGQDEERALVRLNQKLAGQRAAAAARRVAAARQGALDRRRAGDGADALGPRLRRRAAASDGRAAAGDAQGAARHLRDRDHRRPAAAGVGRSRPGGARLARPRSARRPAGARPGQRPHGRARHRRRAIARRASKAATGRNQPQAVRNVVVGASGGAPVHLGDVADVADGGGEPTDYVMQYPRSRPGLSGRHAVDRQAQGHQRDRADARGRAQGRDGARLPAAARSERLGHAQLRRDRRAEIERAALAHVPGGRVGVGAHLAGARPPRVARRADRDSRSRSR